MSQLAEGNKVFTASYHVSTPPEPEVVACRVENINLFPVFLNHQEVLVFGYFTVVLCYSYSAIDGTRCHRTVTMEKTLAELVPVFWEAEPEDKLTLTAASLDVRLGPEEPWQCRAKPLGTEAKPAAQGIRTLASLFPVRPRSLKVSVRGNIRVHVCRVVKGPEKPSGPLEDKPLTSPNPEITGEMGALVKQLVEEVFAARRESKATSGGELPSDKQTTGNDTDKGKEQENGAAPILQQEDNQEGNSGEKAEKQTGRPSTHYSSLPTGAAYRVSNIPLKSPTTIPARGSGRCPAPVHPEGTGKTTGRRFPQQPHFPVQQQPEFDS